MRAATGESDPDVEESQIAELEQRLSRFRIQVPDDMTIRGNAWQGFAHNAYTCDELGLGAPTPPGIGACCLSDGTCEEVTPGQCLLDGGTFIGGLCVDTDCTGACCDTDGNCTETTQDGCGGDFHGIGTDCDPNPCPPPTTAGACCTDGVCSVVSPDDCMGTYFGDGTTCEDLTCACPCGFAAFDMSGRQFLTYQRTISGSIESSQSDNCDPPGTVSTSASVSGTFEQHYESDGMGGCNLITDLDSSSSEHTHFVNGVEAGDSPCSLGNVQCFCSSSSPFNECDGTTFYGDSTNCGNSDRDITDSATATTRTTTITFSQDDTQECFICLSCELTCHVGGTYVITETLSNECIPI